jgi:2,5-diamino-6-(ribosylamino)-4(3H)-pyrimidinone 5'-phosphate reductase
MALSSRLIDELSLLHYPVVDGDSTSATVFEQGANPGLAARFELLSATPRSHGILWLRYQRTAG